jgi:hypothetical protein
MAVSEGAPPPPFSYYYHAKRVPQRGVLTSFKPIYDDQPGFKNYSRPFSSMPQTI